MPPFFRSIDFVLLIGAASSLVAGLFAAALGEITVAHALWLAGALPVVVVLAVSIAKGLLRREAGVDILALLAIALAFVLGESLTGAVIALMLASGRALETCAQQRAEREITALLSRAPHFAHRFESRSMAPRGGGCSLPR
ncbi:hypothetical protein B0G57_103146 [Trinickia symbiotica]|nr:hypothetical protein [Trinickia symbiotica]PPK46122.1 hypothetical protein B0G57_103146 [Trinickia symbiotica]